MSMTDLTGGGRPIKFQNVSLFTAPFELENVYVEIDHKLLKVNHH